MLNSQLEEITCHSCGNTIDKGRWFCQTCGRSRGPNPHLQFKPWEILLVFIVCLAVGSFSAGIGITVWINKPPSSKTPIISTDEPVSYAPTLTDTPTPLASNINTQQISPTPLPTPNYSNGKIVFTCQIFKDNNRNQVCIMNRDGSDQRRLTTNDNSNNWYASFAPDGNNVVFSSNQTGEHEIYEMDLSGNQTQLTSLGELYAPEISPNDQSIVFTNAGGTYSSIWIMDRNGNNPHEIFSSNDNDATDPTWSPDGKQILFAMGTGDSKKLYVVNPDGSGLRLVNSSFTTRGRSDWSSVGNKMVSYSGGPWKRKVYIMNSDGSGLTELYSKGNAQGPAFSPDGEWVAFTGYIDNMGNEDGCDIYIIQLDGSKLQNLTKNSYCDWQPRWGP